MEIKPISCEISDSLKLQIEMLEWAKAELDKAYMALGIPKQYLSNNLKSK